jgi:hypothetical protein
MRIETELPIWPTEKCRQNGAHLNYRRTLSSSIPIEDVAKLPGNSEVLGASLRKLLILKIDGGRGGSPRLPLYPLYLSLEKQPLPDPLPSIRY